jgi:hypothetical protein
MKDKIINFEELSLDLIFSGCSTDFIIELFKGL